MRKFFSFLKPVGFIPLVLIVCFLTLLAVSYVQGWIEPTSAPPEDNASAPINIGDDSQYKSGALGIGGIIKGYSDVIGERLCIGDDCRDAWPEGGTGGSGGISYTHYCYFNPPTYPDYGKPACPDTVTIGTQGPCDSGYTVQKQLGEWGACRSSSGDAPFWFRPPGTSCGPNYPGTVTLGKAYVCSSGGDGFGDRQSKNADTIYQAETDGIIIVANAYMKWITAETCSILVDSFSPPTTSMGKTGHATNWGWAYMTMTVPVKNGLYWKTSGDCSNSSIYWVPLN